MSQNTRGLGNQEAFKVLHSNRGRAPIVVSTQLNANNEPKTPYKIAPRNPLQRKVG